MSEEKKPHEIGVYSDGKLVAKVASFNACEVPLYKLMQQESFSDDDLRRILKEMKHAITVVKSLGPTYGCIYSHLARERYSFELYASARGWKPEEYL